MAAITKAEIGLAIRRLREAKGFTQKSLAETLEGLGDSGLSHIEAGRNWPRFKNLTEILDILGADFQDLHYAMQGIEVPPAPPPDPTPGLIEVGDSGIYMSRDAAAELMVRIVKTGAARMDPPPRPTPEEPPSPPLPRPVRTTGGRNEP